MYESLLPFISNDKTQCIDDVIKATSTIAGNKHMQGRQGIGVKGEEIDSRFKRPYSHDSPIQN